MSELNIKNIENPQSVEGFLNFAEFELKKLPQPKIEAEMLMCFALKKERVWLKTHTDYFLTENESAKSREFIEKRKNNIPLAYITGYKIWNGLKITVSPDVLIPRDETEILANYIVGSSQKNKSGLVSYRNHTSPDLNFSRDFPVKNILDIGTGSGCLSIFMARNFPDAQVTALDICPKALNIAKKNAANHNVEIKFIQSDLLENILISPLFRQRGELKGCLNQDQTPPSPRLISSGGTKKIPLNFDIIIANLPYVPTHIEITEDVKKEPYNAIFSGEDGLNLIRKLAEQIKSREILFQELWLEFWTEQEIAIATIFQDYKVEFLPDLAGDTYFAKITPQTNT